MPTRRATPSDDPLLALLDADGQRLHALLYRVTRRADAAADLLQELFLRLSDSPTFRTADRPGAYARRTAVNLALEWRRRQRPTAALADNTAASTCVAPLDALVRAEDVERVLDALAALPSAVSRLCFAMRFIEQDDYATIAAALGRTPHQVRGFCHAAVRQIRQAVNQDASDRDSRSNHQTARDERRVSHD